LEYPDSHLLFALDAHTYAVYCSVAAEQYNVPSFTGDAMDVITNPDVDAVWICSPSQYHAEQIKAAAANGKHVFCEKPIATDLGETVEAINACNEAGVKLMIGLQRRFDDNFRRVREAVENKEVGETIMVSGPHKTCFCDIVFLSSVQITNSVLRER
jgi:myo-inositol 2-dehydrogenase/D-chiro-inositol 1-dehydrogenase